MAEKTIIVLDPTVDPAVQEATQALAPRVSSLNDKILGILWNRKPNGDVLLLRIKEQLSQRFNFKGSNWREKRAAENSADIATLEELARTSDLVINALGD